MQHNNTTDQTIDYPYIPENGSIKYVPADNEFMLAAKKIAEASSLDKAMPNASVIVKDCKIIGQGANGSDYHETHECERIKQNIPTGQGYELCEGCHPKNHSEPKAVADAIAKGESLEGASLYLWGHWWCCQPCWKSMLDRGLNTVYLLENSQVLFNKAADGNIVGKQFVA